MSIPRGYCSAIDERWLLSLIVHLADEDYVPVHLLDELLGFKTAS
jgi:hypothetical protein